jgi:hypothetical protein
MTDVDIIEMTNKFRTLIVTYPDNKDINLSIMKDNLNNKSVQKGLKDRSIHIEYVKKGDKFHIELVDLDGEVKHEADKFDDNYFDVIFKLVDNMTLNTIKRDKIDRSSDIVITDSVGTDDIPTSQDMDDMADEVEEIERLEGEQERDIQPIGDNYKGETSRDFSFTNSYTNSNTVRNSYNNSDKYSDRYFDSYSDKYSDRYFDSYSDNKEITKDDYLRMKQKYIKLRESIYDGF